MPRGIRLVQLLAVSLAVLVLAAAVASLLRGTRPSPERAGSGSRQAQAERERRAVARLERSNEAGFDVTVENFAGPERRLRVRAARAVTDPAGTSVLSGGVSADAETEDGHRFEVTAAEARGDGEWQSVRLEGSVQVLRDDGLQLRSDWAQHYGPEGAEVAGGAVHVQDGSRSIRCERAEYKFGPQEYFLDRAITITEARGPTSRVRVLTGEHLYLSRATGELVVRDGVRLVSGAVALAGDRLDATLVEGKARRVQLRGHGYRDVYLESWAELPEECQASRPGRTPLTVVTARGLELLLDASGNPSELRPLDTSVAVRIEGLRPPLLLWSLTASSLEASLRPGGDLRELRATDVRWESEERTRAGEPVEWLQAPQLVARYGEGGALEVAEFAHGLKASQDGVRFLQGDYATYQDGLLAVEHGPRIVTADSRLEARRIELATETGEIQAFGDVLVETRGSGASALGGNAGPVRIRADRMWSLEGGKRTRYEGNCQAWSGQQLLQARSLSADKGLAGLEAEGEVRLLWPLQAAGRVDASSRELRYGNHRAILIGDARLEAPGLRVQGERIEVRLSEDDRLARSIEAWGAPVRTDRAGVTAYSERAVHDAEQGLTFLTSSAEPVRLVDRAGRESLGSSFTLSGEGERVSIRAGADGIARTRIRNQPLGEP